VLGRQPDIHRAQVVVASPSQADDISRLPPSRCRHSLFRDDRQTVVCGGESSLEEWTGHAQFRYTLGLACRAPELEELEITGSSRCRYPQKRRPAKVEPWSRKTPRVDSGPS
jgi:hypothetical protein